MGRNEIDLLKKLYRDELVEYVDCVKKIKALLGVDWFVFTLYQNTDTIFHTIRWEVKIINYSILLL